ncbi:MAG: hypothetical protein ABR568_07295 [Pyrinomonadaceae bacterium]
MRIRKLKTAAIITVSGTRCRRMGIRLWALSVSLGFMCLSSLYEQESHGQEIQSEKAHAQVCPDPAPQTSGSHGFRRVGETIDIPINVADCQPIAFVLRWSNGRSNGTSLVVTFLDSTNQPIHSRSLSGYLTGSFEFPFASLDPQPWFARGSMVSVPTTIVIQAQAPFYPPANISYTVTRIGARSRTPAEVQPKAMPKPQPVSAGAAVLDEQVAMKMRTVEGRVLSQGQGSWASETGKPIRYKLTELTLPEPRVMEIHGRRVTVEFAYRLTLAGAELRGSQREGTAGAPALSKFKMIWLDDAGFPTYSLNSEEISTLIYDRSVLKDGAKISVSHSDGSDMYSLDEPLKYQSNVRSSNEKEEGNDVVGIRSAVRVIGATRMPLVQIELRTNRPFPPRDSALRLQIGKRFFLNELTGDPNGRTLTLTLTREMFAELKQGEEVVAFFDLPDRSGFAGRDVWHFGRLDKGSR